MKSKIVVVSLAIASAALAPNSAALAQIGGSPAYGDTYTSSGDTGNMGQTDYLNTGRQAFQKPGVQDYMSPDTANPGINDHSHAQRPLVDRMMNPGLGGLNQVSTAPMATGSTSIDNTPFPSGQFNYGFKNAPIQPYTGPYKTGRGASGMSMLPNVSLGSVDFNTVDTSGIAPVGMISPGRGMGAPIGRPVITMPSPTANTQSTLNWLQNTFFGP